MFKGIVDPTLCTDYKKCNTHDCKNCFLGNPCIGCHFNKKGICKDPTCIYERKK